MKSWSFKNYAKTPKHCFNNERSLIPGFFWKKSLQCNGFDIFCDIDCFEVTGPNQLYDRSTSLHIIFSKFAMVDTLVSL